MVAETRRNLLKLLRFGVILLVLSHTQILIRLIRRQEEFFRCPILFGRAKILCSDIKESVMKTEKGVKAIIVKLQKMDALSPCTAAFTDYVRVLDNRRSPIKSFANFEFRSCLVVSELNQNGLAAPVPDKLAT